MKKHENKKLRKTREENGPKYCIICYIYSPRDRGDFSKKSAKPRNRVQIIYTLNSSLPGTHILRTLRCRSDGNQISINHDRLFTSLLPTT